jgi:hypothetical protein
MTRGTTKPTNTGGRLEDDDELQSLRAQNIDLQDRLEQREHEAADLADSVMGMASGNDDGIPLGIFPLMLALLFLGWTTSFWHRVEMKYVQASAISMVFGLAVLIVFAKWVLTGIKKINWWMIPKVVVVVSAYMVCPLVVRYDYGLVYEDCVMVTALLLAASGGCERALLATLRFLNNPVVALRRIKGI